MGRTLYNSVQMFEPFQHRNPHFFGKVSLSWFVMKYILKTYSFNLFWTKPLRKNFFMSDLVLKLLNLFVFESFAWKIGSNGSFQRNVGFDLKRAQTFEHCCKLGRYLLGIPSKFLRSTVGSSQRMVSFINKYPVKSSYG